MKRQYYRREKRGSKFLKVLKTIFTFLFFCFFIASLCFFSIFFYFAKDLPDPQRITSRQIAQSTKIYDRSGQVLLYDIHGEEKRTIVPFDKISEYLKKATIALEDASFYQHSGIQIKGMLRGAYKTFIKKDVAQSGSTITQQLIKNSFLSPEKTFARKIKEIILSIEMERKHSKDVILGFYLNQIPYGSNAYGAEAASQLFFGKNADSLTLAEAATLASLPQAPSFYSPYGNNTERLIERRDYALHRMLELQLITQREFDSAINEKVVFSEINQSINAPHFVMYVRDYLNEKYGEDFVEKAGFSVYTTLDWEMQEFAEKTIKEGVEKNEKQYSVSNAALVATNPKTGQILAMVGSRDYFDIKNDGNVNVAIRPRSPGSSFKPFVYAAALEKGLTPQTVVFDLKTEFNPNCSSNGNQKKDQYGLACYSPSNYNGRYSGPVSLKDALAQSLNIPAIKVFYLSGIDNSINLAQKMGLTTLQDRSRYGLALVLGGGEVKLLEMTQAYGIFSQDGTKHNLTPILKIEDAEGNLIEEFKKTDGEVVLNQNIARTMNGLLSDNNARTPVFGERSDLFFQGFSVAAKTGTTQEYRDAWTIGYTPDIVVGVWTGNNDNSPMKKGAAGIVVAGPLWHTFMDKSLNSFIKNNSGFSPPTPILSDKPMLNGSIVNKITAKIDRISGLLATDQTPQNMIEERVYNQIHSILYYINKDSILNSANYNPSQDPQFINWETPVIQWIQSVQSSSIGGINQQPPTAYDNLHLPEYKPLVFIIKPAENSELNISGYNFIEASADAKLGIKQIDFFLDDFYLGTVYKKPFVFNFLTPKNTDTSKIEHFIKIRVYDLAQNYSEKTIPLVLNIRQ